ncbi:MAG: ABC transporter ATP-binding protein [Acidimicrobiales bacterium]
MGDAQLPAAVELRGIRLAYGGLVALSSVDMTVSAGSVTGLIGPNGAGKTSLFDVVCGIARPTAGQVLLHGKDVTRLRPAKRAGLGVARTFQRLELFSSLTVAENVAVSAELANRMPLIGGRSVAPAVPGLPAAGRSQSRSGADAKAVVEERLNRLGLSEIAGARTDTLPTGTARLVEVARALAGFPSVLLLDEPASGLDRAETDQLAGLVAELAAGGLAVLLVEHDVELVMRVCAEIYVLDRGSVIARGTPAEVRGNDAVREAYLGQMAVS